MNKEIKNKNTKKKVIKEIITKKAKVIITIIKEATNQVIQITKAETINFKNLIISMIKIKDIMIKEIMVNKKIMVIKIKQNLLMNSKKAK